MDISKCNETNINFNYNQFAKHLIMRLYIVLTYANEINKH
jgi:hypothetical protein